MTDATDSPTPPGTQPPTRKGRWPRRLLKLVIGLVLLIALAPLAISLPPVRSKIADAIGETLDRRVEIGGASAYWFKGIDLEDIVVHSPEGFDGHLATVRKVHADVDLLSLMSGPVKAKIRVLQPHITFRRRADGTTNADGVLETLRKDDPKDPDPAEPTAADLEVVVIGGKVESLAAQDAVGAAIHDLDVGLTLRPEGDVHVELHCVAAGAATSGGNARLALTADVKPDGSGPFEITVQSLDLARIAPLVEDAAHITDLAGTLEIEGKGTRSAEGTLDGTLRANAIGIRARTPAGVQIGLQRLVASATMRTVQGATDVDANVLMGDLRIEDPSGQGVPYREPAITLAGKGRYHPRGWLRIEAARLDAGQTAQITMPEGFKCVLEPALRFEGKLGVQADLGRIGTLRCIVPGLEPLGGGRLSMTLEGSGDRGLDMGIGVAITNFSLRPSDDFPQGYTEPRVRASLRISHTEEDGSTLRLYTVESRLLNLTIREGWKGLALGIDADERVWVEGAFDAALDLGSASRLLAHRLALEPGERITGALVLGGTGRGRAETMQFATDVRLKQVVFPASWGDLRTPTDLRAHVTVRNERSSTHVEVANLKGMGLRGSLRARLRRGHEGTTLGDLEGQLDANLEGARSWLGGLLGLAPSGRLSGLLRTSVHLASENAGHRLGVTTQLTDLRFQAAPGAVLLNEARVVARANVWLAPEGGRHEAEELKLTTAGLGLDASGSSYVASPETDVDLALQLGGDAAKLAPMLAALLGEGYEDLSGTGPLSGRITVQGSPAEHARNLRVDGELVLGSWKTSGLEVSDLQATFTRAESAEPLSLGVVAGLNRGKAFAQAALTLGGEALPWRGNVNLTDVDTSGVLTSQGIGRLLAFALPALLPAGAQVSVLSGLLTARVEARAPSIEDPALLDGLTGSGKLTMSQGQITNSTLFGGGSNSGLGRVIQGLKLAVPEAGRVLEGATKALTFSLLESEFRVAKRVVHIDRTKLTGQSLVINTRGTVLFDKRLALTSTLVLQGSAGRKLAKLVKGGAIPLRIGGTLADPQVRPDVDMKKLLAGAVGDPKDLLDRLKKGIPKIRNPFK